MKETLGKSSTNVSVTVEVEYLKNRVVLSDFDIVVRDTRIVDRARFSMKPDEILELSDLLLQVKVLAQSRHEAIKQFL